MVKFGQSLDRRRGEFPNSVQLDPFDRWTTFHESRDGVVREVAINPGELDGEEMLALQIEEPTPSLIGDEVRTPTRKCLISMSGRRAR